MNKTNEKPQNPLEAGIKGAAGRASAVAEAEKKFINSQSKLNVVPSPLLGTSGPSGSVPVALGVETGAAANATGAPAPDPATNAVKLAAPVELAVPVELTAPVELANANANAKAKAAAVAKEEANTAAAIKAVVNSEAKAPSGSNASGASEASGVSVPKAATSATSGSSGSSGPSVPVPTPGPSGSAPNTVNQQKLIQVTKNGSDYTATTLVSNLALSDNDINTHKSKISANTQLVKIVQNGPVITGELIQSANSTINALKNAPSAPTGGPPAMAAALANAPKPPTAKGGKYKKHTMKRKAKKSKKTRRH